MSSRFFHEPNGDLAEHVEPEHGRERRPYVHHCTLATFTEVAHRVDELDTFTLDELAAGLPNSQVALALRFLHLYGLVERVHPRRNRRTEESVHLSALTAWHALREGAAPPELHGAT